MLIYTIKCKPGQGGLVEKRLHIRGRADATQWENLRTVFFDSLDSCDHLVVNIENVEGLTYPLAVLICSTRRSAQFLGKRLTVVGKASDSLPCALAAPGDDRNRTDTFSNNGSFFCLWESCARHLHLSAAKGKKGGSKPGRQR